MNALRLKNPLYTPHQKTNSKIVFNIGQTNTIKAHRLGLMFSSSYINARNTTLTIYATMATIIRTVLIFFAF